ncbi:hypothetical protein GCM10017668_67720 [Streptomyces tuirus]|uniref:Uncharacterized protein n=1 Tax=Streptomyces tuirus TaxID=68278 RepID=A0A7G1NQ08_9ACTN|nr:hypothetical protein GCM10017668_67720 [Streptomyces tuirus]
MVLACRSRPRSEWETACGSTGVGWKRTPEPAVRGSNRAWVASVTSCPLRASPAPSPVYGATSPREPAVMITTRMGPSVDRPGAGHTAHGRTWAKIAGAGVCGRIRLRRAGVRCAEQAGGGVTQPGRAVLGESGQPGTGPPVVRGR